MPFKESHHNNSITDNHPKSESIYIEIIDDLMLECFKQGRSDKHLRDITSMLKISSELIDRAYISSWARKRGVSELWEEIQKKV